MYRLTRCRTRDPALPQLDYREQSIKTNQSNDQVAIKVGWDIRALLSIVHIPVAFTSLRALLSLFRRIRIRIHFHPPTTYICACLMRAVWEKFLGLLTSLAWSRE